MDGSVARNTCASSCISSDLPLYFYFLITQVENYFRNSCELSLFCCPVWPTLHSKLMPSSLCFKLELLYVL